MTPMPEMRLNHEPTGSGFRPVRLVLSALVLLSMIFIASRWYAATVSIPRYCAQPELALLHLAAVLTEERPAGDGPRRDFIVAAKLGFLLPSRTNETTDAYLARLRTHLERECG
jgi:hypothetical protein